MKNGEMKLYDGWPYFVPACDVCGMSEEPMLIEVHNALMCGRCQCMNSIYICKGCILEAVKLIKEENDE